MALSETINKRVIDLTNGVTELLVPFFLVGIGLHFNLTAFSNTSTLLFAVVILVAAIVTKLLGCGLGAIQLGRADALRIGTGMMPRGEVGMVVAQLGLAMSIVSEAVFGVVVFMSVATTVLAPPLLAVVYRGVPSRKVEPTQTRIG
jgi:Kef-type K+ transport system membrane component KefB